MQGEVLLWHQIRPDHEVMTTSGKLGTASQGCLQILIDHTLLLVSTKSKDTTEQGGGGGNPQKHNPGAN